MTRAVTLAEIADTNTFVVDGANSRVGINSSSPTTTLDVGGAVVATSFTGDGSGLTNVGIGTTGSINTSGIVTATKFVVAGVGLTGAGGINITGVVTAASFSGDGSGLTGVANTAIINSNQINVVGVVTAASFSGDGSALTGVSAGLASSTVTLQVWLFGGG